jgi:glycerol-3-phosphate cytidylyltransferase
MYNLGYVPGAWDLLHRGHLALLQRARAQCITLVVGVVSDDGVAAYKRRPIQDEATRLEIVRQLRLVDHVVLQPTTDPTPVLDAIRPDALFHGDDWDKLREGHETLDLLGIDYVSLPYTRGISTTDMIAAIVERGMAVT